MPSEKSKIIELNEDNWKEYRKLEAERQYPIDTRIQCGQSWCREPDYDNFFVVRKITPTGILVTEKLRLNVVDRDCDQGGGWIDYDPTTAKPLGKNVSFFPFLKATQHLVSKFPNKWGIEYFIDWKGSENSGYYKLKKLKPGKNGLVRAIMGGCL